MTTNQAPARRTGGISSAPKATPKAKKPMSRFSAVVASFLVFLMILAGAGYCLFMNVGGVAEKALVLLPQYKKSMAALDKQRKDIAGREAQLQQDRDKLNADVKANAKTAEDLKNQEVQLKADRQAFGDQQQTAKSAEEKKKAVIDIYTNLDSSAAAAMLSKAPMLQEAADILKMLPAAKVAEILAVIEAKDAMKAYDLTKLLMQ